MTEQQSKEQEEISSLIQKSQQEKSKQFRELVETNPNKRLYQQRIVIQWAEVVDINKDDLKYVETFEDKKFNQELFKKASTDIALEALKMAKSIQDNEKFCIEDFEYSGREYSNCKECPERDINVHAIDLNDAPPEVQSLLRSIAQGIKGKGKEHVAAV